jgi:transposase
MSRFLEYSPDQAYLLPPSVKDELGADHLSFFLHQVVERLDLSEFELAYGEEGGAVYAPGLMLKVWLYAYALGITSARRLEQRIVEDLALRYLAGGQRPDNWALSAFRRPHGRALNDVFTQVVEMARGLGMGKLGMVALDSTRIRASASREKIDTEQRLRNQPAKIRRQIRHWQKACETGDPDEGAGSRVRVEKLEERLAELRRRKALWKLPELWKNQRTVFPQLLEPSVHSSHNAGCCWTIPKHNFSSTPPVFGVLKQQRGMRQFRTRGQIKGAAEFALAAIAYTLTHLFTRRRNL